MKKMVVQQYYNIEQVNHNETGADSSLSYHTTYDQAQGTAFQRLYHFIGNDNDQCGVGTLFVFNPSSTTFVKNFISVGSMSHASNYAYQYYVAGYLNTTSAIDDIQFKMSSGNIDSGTIKLYGIKDS